MKPLGQIESLAHLDTHHVLSLAKCQLTTQEALNLDASYLE
jgi:hypothetical protein